MEERDNKTIMCSVLFLDIAEYSKRPVSEQISLKDGFNAFLSTAIRNVPIDDRIILDTGDGAAISFLGDVGDALMVALSLRESFFKQGLLMTPPLLVRLGINLGPVRLVKDINGQPNIVGDGINVAQRIMGFSDPGQILVSRSYYDAVSRLSQEYAGMFHYQGSRTDKHVREHEVYAIGYPGEFTATQNPVAMNHWQAAVLRLDKGIRAARSAFQNASSQQRALYIGVPAAALVLLIAVLVKVSHRPATPLPQVAEVPSQPVAAQAVSEVAETAPKIAEPMAEKKPTAVTMAEEKPKAVQPAQETRKQVPAGQEKAGKKLPHSTRTLEETTAVNPSAKVRTLEETTVVKPGVAALVNVAVMPWGEVYLDGRMQGVSPPLAELQVAPGNHEIEIRNTIFPVYTQSIHVKAGEKIKIKHKFAN